MHTLICRLVFVVSLLPSAIATAQRGPDWLLPLPEVEADEKIPSSEKALGHRWGHEISSHSQIERYLQALTEAATDRTRLVRYGESYEGRDLYYLVISSPQNIKRLGAIRTANLQLSDPRKLDPAAAEQIASSAPGIVWLAYSVHGNEISSSDAALLTAYHLLADKREVTRQWLEKLVVIIDPLQNPDGRERFVNVYREMRGVFPQSSPASSEHTERWPRGRSNHYWFDMNRDWFRHSQRETRHKVAAYLRWQPQIYVDAHEMGSNSTYYFAPPTDPISPFLLKRQRDWFFRIGRHQASRFDQYGFAYTTREMFDAFYPGYGSEWPTLQGGIGILWEQASSRGLIVDRNDETQLHYHDGVRHHYVSGLATVEVAAKNRERLLRDFHASRKRAIQMGEEGPVTDYFLLVDNDPYRAARLARLLRRNGIEVGRTTTPTRVVCRDTRNDQKRERVVPRGSYHVSVAQPTGRLVRTLLDRRVDMDEEFVARQLKRNDRRLRHEIYDVTAWSLPLAFDVTCWAADSVEVTSEPWDGKSIVEFDVPQEAKVAYLLPPHDGATRALAQWLRAGLRVHVADRALRIGEADFPRGTLIVKTRDNPARVHQAVAATAKRLQLQVFATDTAFVTSGAHFGGPYVRWVRPPKVAMLIGDPMSYSAGHTWHLFDQWLRYPVTRVVAQDFRRLDLRKFNTLILPSGNYSATRPFSGAQVESIKTWVQQGGTLILVKGATAWATGDDVQLLSTSLVKKSAEKKEGQDESAASGESPDSVPGAFLRATVDDEHWLTSGYRRELDVFVTGNIMLKPLELSKGRNLVTFAGRKDVLVSGFCWPQTLDLIRETPFLVYRQSGNGHIIAFTDDPNYRSMYPSLQTLFLNAVLFGAAH